MYNPYDHYFKKAKKSGYKARSAFKLEEIDQKFDIFNQDTKSIIDIGCSPGSWLQYAYEKLTHQQTSNKGKASDRRRQKQPEKTTKKQRKDIVLLGFDLKPTNPIGPEVFTYQQDIQEQDKVKSILDDHQLTQVDVIISDMAPSTTGDKQTDALRSIALIESTMRMYKQLLKEDGKFVIKVFMGPGFDQLRDTCKQIFGPKAIKVYKPKACRKNSKETYIVKI